MSRVQDSEESKQLHRLFPFNISNILSCGEEKEDSKKKVSEEVNNTGIVESTQSSQGSELGDETDDANIEEEDYSDETDSEDIEVNEDEDDEKADSKNNQENVKSSKYCYLCNIIVCCKLQNE
jgi:hypothetical protein